MAGDWIKVEHATVDKPEVALFSELLGVPVPHGFGLLVVFWMWCDKHSRDGLVTQVSRMSVDTVTHTPGFAAALEAIGWGVFDDSCRTLTLPNFVRHNEAPAKSRALTRDRMKRSRDAASVTTASPEKRREEKSTTSLRSVVAHPRLGEPTDEHLQIALESGVNCQAEFEKYQDWLAASGKKHKDPVAGFRNWLRRAGEFKPALRAVVGGMTAADRRADTADQMFRRGKYAVNDSSERDISGLAERLD
jgi:hypothetical protein